MFCTFWLPNVRFATAACKFSTSEQQKVFRTHNVLYILASKCTSRHSGVPFLHVGTSKSALNTSCFAHFHFQMCFSPQRRAIFRHQTSKKCFGALYILTSKCAFRHSVVHFFDIASSKSAPKLTCFVHFHFKMCFSPQWRAIFDFSSEHLPPHPL